MRKEALLGVLRIALGWIFFWPFLDKLFGLGFSTKPSGAWLAGGSPTAGFLSHVAGPLKSVFNPLAGQVWVDVLFMAGLLLIGLALLFGVGVRIAAYSGSLLLVLMWLASLPIATNPFLDEHIVFALTLFALSAFDAGRYLGFGRWWRSTKLVREYPFLA